MDIQFDKTKIKEQLLAELKRELATAVEAARAAHADATNDESRAENQYDTRALEASYVARGQAKRVDDLKEMVFQVESMPMKSFSSMEKITNSALVQVSSSGRESWLLFMPKGGGLSLQFEGIKIQVVTPQTPLGEALFEMQEGDEVIIEMGTEERHYDIIKVL